MRAQRVSRAIAWIAIVAVLLLALTAPHIPGWIVGISVASALALGIPTAMKQKRRERDLVRRLWRKRERSASN
jgi:hypothetical protein